MLKERTTKIHKAKVQTIEKISTNSYLIELESDGSIISDPGKYISILCDNLTLRRPFSIASQTQNRMGVLFKEKGKGTKYIKSLNVGDIVDFIGPLGNGFDIIQNQKSLLIGAGIGVAPIFYLKNELQKQKIESLSIGGFFSATEIPNNINCDKIITNDGTLGEKGSVIDYLEEIIKSYNPKMIYACGPKIVLQKVSELAQKHNIESQIAMEKVMACGIGVCRGCVIKIKRNDTVQNATICKDGPVFKGSEILW